MKSYLFSIFVRFYLAFSGFLVFLITAFLFGADGRGVIGYGTSLFAVAGIVFSGNLGRVFVSKTRMDDLSKRQNLEGFIVLNVLLSLLALVAGIIYWHFSYSAKTYLSLSQVLFFSLTSFFHVWSVNGNAFFAAFLATKRQETIILVTRTSMIVFLAILYLFKINSLDIFIAGYCGILFLGTLVEMNQIYKWYVGEDSNNTLTVLKSLGQILKNSLYHHLDHLFFYSYPLVLTVFSGTYLLKADLGKFNFALQIINLVFLFAVTANIRLTSYVADVGYRARIVQFKKLFWATLSASSVAVLFIAAGLHLITKYKFGLSQFDGVEGVFVVCATAVPGYVLYQFFSPVWVEMRKEKTAALLHGFVFIVCLSIYKIILTKFILMGAAILFGLFYFLLSFVQLGLYYFIIPKHRKNG